MQTDTNSFSKQDEFPVRMNNTEIWNMWSAILPLGILAHLMLTNPPPHHQSHTVQLMHTGVYTACITCQLCSFLYHTFNPVSLRIARALYNLDLAGVCCMSLGSPYIYAKGYGMNGLETYTAALFALMLWCHFLIAKATLKDQEATCERWIIALSALGNIPSLAHPTTATAAATILAGYVIFYRLCFPDCIIPMANGTPVSSHVLWHWAVFAGQMGYVWSTFNP